MISISLNKVLPEHSLLLRTWVLPSPNRLTACDFDYRIGTSRHFFHRKGNWLQTILSAMQNLNLGRFRKGVLEPIDAINLIKESIEKVKSDLADFSPLSLADFFFTMTSEIEEVNRGPYQAERTYLIATPNTSGRYIEVHTAIKSLPSNEQESLLFERTHLANKIKAQFIDMDEIYTRLNNQVSDIEKYVNELIEFLKSKTTKLNENEMALLEQDKINGLDLMIKDFITYLNDVIERLRTEEKIAS